MVRGTHPTLLIKVRGTHPTRATLANSKPVISVIFDGNHKELPRQSLERHKPLMV